MRLQRAIAKLTSQTSKRSPAVLVSNLINNSDAIDQNKESPLLPYQVAWFFDDSKVRVDVKSRQIGWTFTYSILSVYKAICGYNVIYNCYNIDSGKSFISLCAKVVRYINKIERICPDDSITKTIITLDNGATISCIPSKPDSFRGKPGYKLFVIIDEAAFRQNLPEILKAAMALLIWGGQIRIASTHNGIENDFNKLVKEIESGKREYKLYVTPFREAIAQGLYKKICSKTEEEWSPEKEAKWVDEQYKFYGITASEELDCIPSDFSQENKIFIKEHFIKVERNLLSKSLLSLRYWDFASTVKPDSYYTASVRCDLVEHNNKLILIIVNYTADKKLAKDAITLMRDVMEMDDNNTIQILEKEPGTSSEYFFSMFSDAFNQYIKSYTPKVKKILRAIPAGNGVMSGKIQILDEYWADDFIDIISRFSSEPKPLITDLGDCLSGIYDYYNTNLKSFYS